MGLSCMLLIYVVAAIMCTVQLYSCLPVYLCAPRMFNVHVRMRALTSVKWCRSYSGETVAPQNWL